MSTTPTFPSALPSYAAKASNTAAAKKPYYDTFTGNWDKTYDPWNPIVLPFSAKLVVAGHSMQLPEMGHMNRPVPNKHEGKETNVQGFKVWTSGLITTYRDQLVKKDERAARTKDNIKKMLYIHALLAYDNADPRRSGDVTDTITGEITGKFWVFTGEIVYETGERYECDVILEQKTDMRGNEEKTVRVSKVRTFAGAVRPSFNGDETLISAELAELGIH